MTVENLENIGVSVIMPTYKHEAFIKRAILSLMKQTHINWELIIINDSSNDRTPEIINDFLNDKRIRYYKNEDNIGLGACLNYGIDLSKFDLISYLPSDDYYKHNHLLTLIEALVKDKDIILAYSGIKYCPPNSVITNKPLFYLGQVPGFPLQLVQVMHKKLQERWIERSELVTDDLFNMYWKKVIGNGMFVPTNEVTSEWTSHPRQRHKIINEKLGGSICLYREYYKIKESLKFQSSKGAYIDENEIYSLSKNEIAFNPERLKILLVGELAYNPDRILAFEECGHKLYGLWLDEVKFSNFVGPLPFGNVTDVSVDNWIEEIAIIKPDIIYALLNSETVKFAHSVLKKNPGIPFVWHFKEGPSFCLMSGTWDQLIELYKLSDGQIFINNEIKEWFKQYININEDSVFILDGDLPKKEWFTNKQSSLFSNDDGEIHTVLPGRPMGIMPEDIAILAKQKIHFHVYGNYQEVWREWISKAIDLAPGFIHVHPNCSPKNWVKELSTYDAGWLHYFESTNKNEIMEATWDDLNLPARISTLAAAGLPMLQRENLGHIVATQSLTKKMDIGIFFNSFDELGLIMRDKKKISKLRKNVWDLRMEFTFDYHIENLIIFFKKIITNKKASK